MDCAAGRTRSWHEHFIMHCGDDVSVGGKLLCDANKHLLHAISVSGLNCRIHKGSELLPLIRGRLDAEVTLQAFIEVVAWLGAGGEEASANQRAEHA